MICRKRKTREPEGHEVSYFFEVIKGDPFDEYNPYSTTQEGYRCTCGWLQRGVSSGARRRARGHLQAVTL